MSHDPHHPEPYRPSAPPPAGYWPAPPVTPVKRKRHLWLWLALAVVLLFGGCVAAVATIGNSSTGTTATGTVTAKTPAASIGQSVRDGKFEFTVTKIESGVPRVGTDVFGRSAQGQYVLLHVMVRNVAGEAQTFDGGNQKLFDSQGREFTSDTAASLYLPEAKSFLEPVNPGNQVSGVVGFDIPKDVTPARVELHDSFWSRGVTVTL